MGTAPHGQVNPLVLAAFPTRRAPTVRCDVLIGRRSHDPRLRIQPPPIIILEIQFNRLLLLHARRHWPPALGEVLESGEGFRVGIDAVAEERESLFLSFQDEDQSSVMYLALQPVEPVQESGELGSHNRRLVQVPIPEY